MVNAPVIVPLRRQALQCGDRRLSAFEVGFHRDIVHLEGRVDQFGAVLLRVVDDGNVGGHGDAELRGQVRRDVQRLPLGVLVVRIPDQRLVFDQVDHALEVVFRADGDLQRQRAGAQALDDHVDAARERGAAAVHLVDIAHAWHVVVVGQAPVGFGLRFHAGHAVEHHDCAVEHAQGAVHFDGEVHVARGVDDVDLLALPEGRHGGGLDGDATLLFLLKVVRRGRRLEILGVVDVDDGVLAARVIQDALGGRGLAGIDVGDDANVADVGQRCSTGHCYGSITEKWLWARSRKNGQDPLKSAQEYAKLPLSRQPL